MNKSKVYTRGGDKGETSLVSGNRCLKSEKRINLYGEVDELNSHLGYFLALLEKESIDRYSEIKELNVKTQNILFDLGSLLACEDVYWEKYKLKQIDPLVTDLIEKQIDELDSALDPLKNFILPGGSISASYGHVLRTKCRSVERSLVGFQGEGNKIPENSLNFLNRLSDYFFVLSRYINKCLKQDEVLWKSN